MPRSQRVRNAHPYAVQFTPKSRNRKVGPIPVSTTAARTCPASCPLKGSGCYAETGPIGLLWRALSKARPGSNYRRITGGIGHAHDWPSFVRQIAALPEGTLWRHNQAGDLPGDGDVIDTAALDALVRANEGRRGFTYTHKPLTPPNAAAIADANARGFTTNVSANTLHHADALAQSKVAPVVAVLTEDLGRGANRHEWTEDLNAYRERVSNITTPQGRKVVVCPATYLDTVSCKSCQLCQRVDRNVIVGFPAHGAGKRKASQIAQSKGDHQ